MSMRDLMNVGTLAAEAEAIRRTQAVIEFDPSGKILSANDLFLKAVGYSLAEIEGQHHAIFVEGGERATPEYQRFWSRLAAGEAIEDQFLRIGKGGSRLWLQAVNPTIADAIMDRIAHNAYRIELAGESLRKRQPEPPAAAPA